MDGWMDAIALPPVLTQSVIISIIMTWMVFIICTGYMLL